ncbi:MAG: class I SAM-dependent methyltransferase [Anaerolineales bacterium]
MSLLQRLSFALAYYRRPPWDSGIVPPEVEAFIAEHPPGRALDLGCGTGTSSLALAQAGWQVTGIDFAPRAIAIARQKAAKQNLTATFQVGNVVHLPPALFALPHDLILDIGCFHSLSAAEKIHYLHNLDRLLARGGTWLLYAFIQTDTRRRPGIHPADLEIASIHLTLIRRQDGHDRRQRPSAWFWFEKKN